jgi:uncharacterized membrane protein
MQNMNGKTALGLDANVGAALCYINICLPIGLVYSIIVLVTEKSNRLVRFHAFQSLLLLAALIIVGFIFGLVLGFMAAAMNSTVIPLGFNGLFSLVVLGLSIFMAMKGYNGEMFKLPVIGDMAEKWA